MDSLQTKQNWTEPGFAENAQSQATKTFMTNVFAWMSGALMITALTAYLFGKIPSLMEILYRIEEGQVLGFSALGWVVIFAPLALVLLMSFAFNRLSMPALVGVFMLYSAVNGMSLSTIFLRYETGIIGAAFLITAGMFGAMAVMGYITKADLSKFGSIMFMGLIGIVIASLVNMFMHSDTLDYIISFAGVAVFTGLTAWDVQKLKEIGSGTTYGNEVAGKLSILGALTLYLDFINLFLFILRLMGRGRD
ncbi:MAG: Bax inhibitor-1/YccA family protein [Bacteroidia bacterium]